MKTSFSVKFFALLTVLILLAGGGQREASAGATRGSQIDSSSAPAGATRGSHANNRAATPAISAYLSENRVDASGWAVGGNLHLTINDTAFTADQAATACAGDPTSGCASFDLGSAFTLAPGQVISVSGADPALSILTRTLLVADLYVTSYDPVAKTVSGHSEPDEKVGVSMWADNGWKEATADASGLWAVAYGPSTGPFTPFTGGEVTHWDEDDDATVYRVNMGSIVAFPDYEEIELWDCTKYRAYTLNIDDPATSAASDFSAIAQSIPDTSGGAVGVASFALGSFDLAPGHKVTMSSGHDVRTLTVAPQGGMHIDTLSDAISGINPPGSWVKIRTGNSRTVKADASGAWSIDYQLAAPDGAPVEDILLGMSVAAYEYDADGDQTYYQWLATAKVYLPIVGK